MKLVDRILRRAVMAALVGAAASAFAYPDIVSEAYLCPLDTRVCKAVTSVDQVLPIAVSGCNFTNDAPGTATVVADLGPARETIASDADDDLTTVAWTPSRPGVWILSHTVGGETLTGMLVIYCAFP